MSNFYQTLSNEYEKNSYGLDHIWNCDGTGLQAGMNCGMRVIVKGGSMNVPKILPKIREWIVILCCVNTIGLSIPGYPNWIDITKPLETNPDPIVQQILLTTVEEEIIESSHQPVGPIGDNNSVKGNQRRKAERWDCTPSPRKDRSRYPFFEHPFNRIQREEEEMERREREREMHRREEEEILERHEHEEEELAENEQEIEQEPTIGFPILDLVRKLNMKNIPPSALPTFYGKPSEGPDVFLFEFDILCRSYKYSLDAHKLKLFPSTLKDSALCWFMSLGEYTIRSWDDMKASFLKRYQDYCRPRDSRNDIFKIQQHEDESLEDYLERFVYLLHKSKYKEIKGEALMLFS